jgi:hypothetical protein
LAYTVGETTHYITREVTAGTGWGSQGSVGLHFGLGTISKEQIVSLTATFPSEIEVALSADDFDLNQKFFMCEVDAKIEPDDDQCGETGDIVPSSKSSGGEKHYVSPKKASSYVVLKAEVTPEGTNFDQNFEWEGGEAVTGSPEKCKVSRGTTGKTVVKLKYKGGAKAGQDADKINVWIIWATWEEVTKVKDVTVKHKTDTQPKQGQVGPGTWVETEWRFVAKIEPAGIITEDDIPDLTGKGYRPVPGGDDEHIGNGKDLKLGQNLRWDVSRRIRIKVISESIGTNDYVSANGKIYDNLPTTPAEGERTVEDYETDDDPDGPTGNDDTSYSDEDNDPYEDKEDQPGNPGTKTPKGKVASSDYPKTPEFIDAAGDNGDTVQWKIHFQEFVRLQIGVNLYSGYKNWYRVSELKKWRYLVKLKKQGGTWEDDGCVSEENNNGW